MREATDAHDDGDLDRFNAIATTLAVLGFKPSLVNDVLDGWTNAGAYFSAYGERRWPLENNPDGWLYNVHDLALCTGQHCTVHNRSDHTMRSFPQHWRGDRGIMERICPHGVGHPDPDSPWDDDSYQWVHGCDGCCHES